MIMDSGILGFDSGHARDLSNCVGDDLLQARSENYPRDVHLAALGLNFESGNPKSRRLGRRLLHHGQMPREIS